ncbi:MAG: aminotransferase class I/II-fold pyridoxal phosphate-dependent enzyme [Treponema sp.]|jgi:aspartate/methionine/tyrosine aminotransferase|nr:aminotransferase class I/II-fold pyridoxal phosphate-dependent enzyme [Treponema sp.]
MNPLAEELNAVLDGTTAGRLLSKLGRRLYFPRGIISQAAEAKQKAHRINATIGMAYRGGKPLMMSAIADSLPNLTAEETVIYAPTAGVEQVRQLWQAQLLKKNPSLRKEHLSLPIVTPGITAGISYSADLFLDEDVSIISSRPCWDNYNLIFRERRGAVLREIPFFTGRDTSKPGLDLESIGTAIREEAKTGTMRIILNFPNNPSGYAPTRAEADTLVSFIEEAAQGGADVLALCDDAYFGLFYENDTIKESLFSRLASLHERVLAIKVDGPTKEDYAWGFRMAFVTVGSLGLTGEHYEALKRKYMGAIRSSVSCANTPAQYLTLKTLADKRTDTEKEAFYAMLQRRYEAVKRFINDNSGHPVLTPLPFNSGYFMCFHCMGISAETLRRELLEKHGIGTVALEDVYLRITFAAVDEEHIAGLYQTIYETAASLRR